MSFIATAPTSPSTPSSTLVTNDGFFPDIDLDQVRHSVRLDGTVTPPRLRDAVRMAVIGLNRELATWKATQLAAGITSLSQLEPKIDGESEKQLLYLVAVERTAKADLTEQYRDFDTTKSGLAATDKEGLSADEHRRAARWAVREILGVNRVTVELI